MEAAGTVMLVTSAALIVGVATARARFPGLLADLLIAVAGAGLAVGGLLLLGDASVWSWMIAPPVAAALSVLHVRLLTAPGGPMRT